MWSFLYTKKNKRIVCRREQYINQHQHTVKRIHHMRKNQIKTIEKIIIPIGNTEYSQISESTLTQPNILHIEREQQNGSHQYTQTQRRRDVNLID